MAGSFRANIRGNVSLIKVWKPGYAIRGIKAGFNPPISEPVIELRELSQTNLVTEHFEFYNLSHGGGLCFALGKSVRGDSPDADIVITQDVNDKTTGYIEVRGEGGIIFRAWDKQTDFYNSSQAPDAGYEKRLGIPSSQEGLYFIRTRDGKHYAKFRLLVDLAQPETRDVRLSGYFYDLQGFATPPTKGNLTTLSRKKAGSTFLDTNYEYDAYERWGQACNVQFRNGVYDWFDPSLVTPDSQNFNVPAGIPASLTPIRTLTYSYHNPAPLAPTDSGANSVNVYAKRPIPPINQNPTPFILNAVKQTDLGPSSTKYFYDLQGFATPPTKGNLTTLSRKKTGSTFLDTNYEYDAYGNKTRVTDPAGNKADYVFDIATHAQPTSITVYPDPNNLNIKQITSMVYDFSTGLVTQQTDVNGNITTIDYRNQRLTTNPLNPVIDPFGRPGLVTGPAVTSLVGGVPHTNQHQTAVTTYFDTARQTTAETDLNTEGDLALKTKTTVDQLGRTTKVESAENGTYTISAETVYKDAQRLTFTSNAHRAAAADTDGWTRSTRDTLGRVIQVVSFPAATMPADTGRTKQRREGSGLTFLTFENLPR